MNKFKEKETIMLMDALKHQTSTIRFWDPDGLPIKMKLTMRQLRKTNHLKGMKYRVRVLGC